MMIFAASPASHTPREAQVQKGLVGAMTLVCSVLSRAAIGFTVAVLCSYLVPHGTQAAAGVGVGMGVCCPGSLSPGSGDKAFVSPTTWLVGEQPQLRTLGCGLSFLSEHPAPWPRRCGLRWAPELQPHRQNPTEYRVQGSGVSLPAGGNSHLPQRCLVSA